MNKRKGSLGLPFGMKSPNLSLAQSASMLHKTRSGDRILPITNDQSVVAKARLAFQNYFSYSK